jgi:transketolase
MLIKNFWEKFNKEGKNAFEQIPTRKGFGEGLLLAGKNNKDIVALTADLVESTQVELFKKTFPERFFEMGVAEQNMASVASGMASMGKTPFMTSYAMFSPGRNWEQIRTTIAYNNVPVKIVGCHAGVSVGPDGGTHQALEDIALMRVVPNMVVVVPCDAVEAKKATLAIASNNLPSYLRLFREKSPVITDERTPFEVGKANLLYQSSKESGQKIGIIASGEMVSRSVFITPELESMGFQVGVLNLHTIKPIDKDGLRSFVNKYKTIITIEEHQIAGGMGSAVLEYLAEANLLKDLKLKMVGVTDRFGQSGTKEELFEEYGLNERNILNQVRNLFS